MSSLRDLCVQYAEVRGRRTELERQAKELKEGQEADLQEAILAEMSAQGLKSANVEGIGRVVSRDTGYYEITDIDALARQMLAIMVENHKMGRPLSDGLLLQRRVSRENLELALEDNPEANYGVNFAVKTTLSITKR